MEFRLIAVGRIREPALRTACDEYVRRIRRYVPLSVQEIPDTRRHRAPDDTRAAEAAAVLKHLGPRTRGVALTRRGRRLSSRAFADTMTRWHEDARDLAFVIGGAFGLHGDVLDRCEDRIALSDMTLPHDIARLVLLEQLYRASTIRRGEPYHKGD